MDSAALTYRPIGKGSRAEVSWKSNGDVEILDTLNVASAKARRGFAKAVAAKVSGVQADEVERGLLAIAADMVPKPPSTVETDVGVVVRPDLFHNPAVSGLLIPVAVRTDDGLGGKWRQYLRWADGRREARDLAGSIDLGNGGNLYVHPIPSDPSPTTRPGWSGVSRSEWLRDGAAPNPADVFRRLCEAVAYYLDFDEENRIGTTATLSLWTMLSYVYSAWSAIPYLGIGGPLGSGKSRVFEVLARIVFRPLASSNTTSACLFRTLHQNGGVLLLDEAERLRDGTPDAGDIRSILLSGYKAGSPARRLEPIGDGRFAERTFDVFGLKAIAGIGTMPEALASRCIRITMFRSAPDSPKPRRRIDDDPSRWSDLRDDLHVLAMEHGPTWLALARRMDCCPSMSGRDYELWSPLLALASFIEESGATGLLQVLQEHAKRTIRDSHDEQTPEQDEVFLRLLGEAVARNTHDGLTPSMLLDRAKESDPAMFAKWSRRGVSSTLKRYGVVASKSHGQWSYRNVGVEQMRRIEGAYNLDLGMPVLTSYTSQTSPDPDFSAKNAGGGWRG